MKYIVLNKKHSLKVNEKCKYRIYFMWSLGGCFRNNIMAFRFLVQFWQKLLPKKLQCCRSCPDTQLLAWDGTFRAEKSKRVLLERFDLEDVFQKRREIITQWNGVISQENSNTQLFRCKNVKGRPCSYMQFVYTRISKHLFHYLAATKVKQIKQY